MNTEPKNDVVSVASPALLGLADSLPLISARVETQAEKTWREQRQREADRRGLLLDMIEMDRLNRRLTGDY